MKPLNKFWADRNISRTTGHYIEVIGRAPFFVNVGRKKLVPPDAEAKWDAELKERPIVGNLKELAAAAKRASVAARANQAA